MATSITMAYTATNSGSTFAADISVADADWKSPKTFRHIYTTPCIPMFIDQINNILYIHDESGNHLITFDDTQAAQTTVTGVGLATSAFDLYAKIVATIQ